MKLLQNSVVKNISYTFTANAVSMAVSVVMLIFLPKILTLTDYGFWQLYLFYTSYLGFLHFGWMDGIYLRYAGKYFDELNKELFTTQLLAFIGFEVFLTCMGLLLTDVVSLPESNQTILKYTFGLLLPFMLTNFSSFLLQITNRIQEFAKMTLLCRFLFVILVLVFLLSGHKNYFYLIVADLSCKTVECLYGLWLIRRIFVTRLTRLKEILSEIYININVGSKLLLANIAGMLILGIMRFGIAQHWSIETFGKVSLMLSVSNFMMTFINSLSIVFFPLLKRMDEAKQKENYLKFRTVLTVFMLVILLAYYPIKLLLTWWLPKFNDSLIYMALLFPVLLFESRNVLISNTYLKSLRCESAMLKCNSVVVVFSLAFSMIGTEVANNLDVMVVSIMLLFMLKNLLAEYVLSKVMKIRILSDWLQEIVLVSVFVLGNYYLKNWILSLAIYSVLLITYIVSKKDFLKELLKFRNKGEVRC